MNTTKIQRPSLNTTLKDCIEWFQRTISTEGFSCPVCGQHCKVWERKLYSTMAVGLLKLYRDFEPGEYAHVNRLVKSGGGDFAKLRFWGLIIEKPKAQADDKDTRSSGLWKITPKGSEFAAGKLRVPSHVRIYNQEFKGFVESSPRVSIYDCLGSKYSYDELMGGHGGGAL